jgi:C_GCAxxG_C_C family probable redox protein
MIKAKVREKYRGLSRQELADKAYELGSNFEKYSIGCSQSTVAALHELLDIDDVVVRVATSLSGGTAMQFLGACGALSGGVIALDYCFGRPPEKMSYQEEIKDNLAAYFAAVEAPMLLADKFWKEYGTINCVNIQRQLFGRTFWLLDPDDVRKFEKAGGHSAPDKCCHIVGTAARWAMEILLDKGAIEL